MRSQSSWALVLLWQGMAELRACRGRQVRTVGRQAACNEAGCLSKNACRRGSSWGRQVQVRCVPSVDARCEALLHTLFHGNMLAVRVVCIAGQPRR